MFHLLKSKLHPFFFWDVAVISDMNCLWAMVVPNLAPLMVTEQACSLHTDKPVWMTWSSEPSVCFFCLSFFLFCTQGSLNSPSFATVVDFYRCCFILYLLQFMWYQVPEQTVRLQFDHLQTDFSQHKIIQHFLLHCWKVWIDLITFKLIAHNTRWSSTC